MLPARKTIETTALSKGFAELRTKEAELRESYGEVAGLHTDMRNSHEALAEATGDKFPEVQNLHVRLQNLHETLEERFLDRYHVLGKGINPETEYTVLGAEKIYGTVPLELHSDALELAEGIYQSVDGKDIDWQKLAELFADVAEETIACYAYVGWAGACYLDVAEAYQELKQEYRKI